MAIDLHQQTADACGVDRDEGKRLNYAMVYGAGVPRVAGILGCSGDEAKAILDRWWNTYPEVRTLRRRLVKRVERRGYLQTIGGRRHYFDEPNHMLINRLVSGSCADLFKLSVAELHDAGVPIVLLVHDEIVAEVDEDQAEATARMLERALTGGPITGLSATAAAHRRWSDFKEPGYAP